VRLLAGDGDADAVGVHQRAVTTTGPAQPRSFTWREPSTSTRNATADAQTRDGRPHRPGRTRHPTCVSPLRDGIHLRWAF
jgi:hypothetical protein